MCLIATGVLVVTMPLRYALSPISWLFRNELYPQTFPQHVAEIWPGSFWALSTWPYPTASEARPAGR